MSCEWVSKTTEMHRCARHQTDSVPLSQLVMKTGDAYDENAGLHSLVWIVTAIREKKKKRPRRDSNPQSSDSKSDALSIRPRGPPQICKGK